MLFPDHIQGILHRIPGVDDNRQAHFLRQGDLPPEPDFLHVPRRLLIMVLQADLADGRHLGMARLLRELLQHLFRKTFQLVGVDAQGAVHLRPALRHLQTFPGRCRGSARVQDLFDPLPRKAFDQDLPVLIEVFRIIMRMCINDHCSVFFSIRKFRPRQRPELSFIITCFRTGRSQIIIRLPRLPRPHRP